MTVCTEPISLGQLSFTRIINQIKNLPSVRKRKLLRYFRTKPVEKIVDDLADKYSLELKIADQLRLKIIKVLELAIAKDDLDEELPSSKSQSRPISPPIPPPPKPQLLVQTQILTNSWIPIELRVQFIEDALGEVNNLVRRIVNMSTQD